jgi:hypothetical protein
MLVKTDIEKYFMAEKSESLFFIVLGIAAVCLGVFLFFLIKTYFWRGVAIPLLVIGLIQLIVGYGVYSKSDDQRIRNVYAYDMDPGKLKQEELPRMLLVKRRFVYYRWMEIALLLIAVSVALNAKSGTGRTYWLGWGLALALQSAILLAADRYAERRAREYTQKLEKFTPDQLRAIT